MSERTFKAIRWALGTELLVKLFKVGEEFPLKDFCIRPFRVFHDAVDPCGFRIEGERRKVKVGLATDLGVVTPEVEDNLRGCDVVILEANHDLEMLLEGPYPWELKQRIQSQVGHLSNNAAGEALAKLGEIQKVFLAHLSRINNTPQLALSTISNYLKDKKPDLFPSYHEWMSEVVEI
jgi:phosphoribosyl 1,2-cyclic phosphodiesterase